MKTTIFIVGATAIGKTDVTFLLAQRLKAEIISSDSMLVYKEAKIISARPASDVLKKIKHYFVADVSVKDTYNVFDFYQSAKEKIMKLVKKNIPVIVCGGSGLYVKAILDGIFSGPQKDEVLRQELTEKAQKYGNACLHQELKKVDPQAASKISANDLKRIIRALEVYYLSGKPISDNKKETVGLYGKMSIKIFGLRMKRELLYERINKRVDQMLSDGAIAEVEKLVKLNLSITAKKIIGIKELSQYLEGSLSKVEAAELMKKNTRNFAKRQITWFKKDERIEWIDVDGLTPERTEEEITKRIKN